MPWLSNIVEQGSSYLKLIIVLAWNQVFYGNHSYHIVIKESTFTSKAVKTKELCILRGKSWSYRKHWRVIWVILSQENSDSLRKGYLPAAPLILHTKRKRLASLSNKVMVRFWKQTNLGSFKRRQIITTRGLLTEPLNVYLYATRKLW